MRNALKSPFPYFGGKSSVASFVWQLFGEDIKRYFEPFAGSLAVLFARKREDGKIYHDIVNDLDCLLINAWKALKESPGEVAKLCAAPNSQLLYWQRICYVVKHKEELLQNMIKDDNYYDAKLAAYWLYYKASEIGTLELDRVNIDKIYGNIHHGIPQARIQLISAVGIHSNTIKPFGKELIDKTKLERLTLWFNEIQKLLENTRVMCGDWKRLFNEGSHWQDDKGKSTAAIFFDPPYSDKSRRKLYREDSFDVAKEVNEFCAHHINKKTYRIIIAGYEGEHNNLEKLGYKKYEWHAQGGYGNLAKSYNNKNKERLWASPNCNNINIKSTINEYMKENKNILL